MALTKKQIEAAKKKLPTGRARDEVDARDKGLQELAKTLEEEGDSIEEMAEKLDISPVKAQILRYRNNAKPVDPTPENVVKLRDEDERAWGYIAAATGLTEPMVKKMYTEETGILHSATSIGKGGRTPSDPVERNAPKRPSKKAAAKKAAAKKKAAPKKAASKKKAAPKKTPKKAAKRAPRKQAAKSAK